VAALNEFLVNSNQSVVLRHHLNGSELNGVHAWSDLRTKSPAETYDIAIVTPASAAIAFAFVPVFSIFIWNLLIIKLKYVA